MFIRNAMLCHVQGTSSLTIVIFSSLLFRAIEACIPETAR
jgi:hypothetical protein